MIRKENLIITQEDKKESKKVSQIINKVNDIDEVYINSESDIIYQKQPFLISLLLGYRVDLKEKELEEIMKIIFIIWEYFKSFYKVHKTMISEKLFEQIQQRNIYMLKYFEGENGQNAQYDVVESDLRHLHSKALLTGIFFQFNHKKSLVEMNNEVKGNILIGMKSLIECFDEITAKN
jgi:hypothetical protein